MCYLPIIGAAKEIPILIIQDLLVAVIIVIIADSPVYGANVETVIAEIHNLILG